MRHIPSTLAKATLKRISYLAIAVAALAPITAVAQAPVRGGQLSVGLQRAPTTFDPHTFDGGPHAAVQGAVYNSLLRYSPSGELVPDLAEELIMVDETTLRFRLREGVQFHDGSAMTSDDVLFSFERIMNPEFGATQGGMLRSAIAEISAPDDLTFEIRLQRPIASLVEVLARPDVAIVSRAFVEAGNDLRTTMMGTGPFKLASYEPDFEYRFVRNENYFKDGLPYLDSIRYVPVVDDGARINALYSGELDAIQYVPTEHMGLIEAHPGLEFWSGDAIFMGLFLNTNRAPLDDVRVRKAIALAVDRQAVIDSAFDGRGTVIGGGLIPQGTWAYNADLSDTHVRDLEAARALLAEAGYPDGLEVNLLSASLAIHARPAEAAQAQLREIGIDLNIEVVETAVMLDRRNRGDYEALVFGSSLTMNDPDFYTNYFQTGAPVAYAGPTGFSDTEIDSLLNAARQTFDQGERRDYYHRLEERLLELVPIVFINWREQGYAAAEYVKGFEFIPGVMGLLSEIAYESVWLAR